MMATSPHFRTALLAGSALIFPVFAQAQPAPNARPQGGAVVAGSATIGGDAGRTVINQSTDRAAINWQSFDIGRNQAVQFQQPSSTSVTLNRVISPNPSQIAGQITANGQVAIVNQSGVIFHQGSTVNAAGLVVSTANITNEAFMAGGRMNFNQPGRPDARIENNGTITVREAGLAALVAPQVANHGVIRARMGRVVLAGAETSVVDLHGDGLLSLEVTSPVRQAPGNGQALVTNTGTVTATGGTVVLTAQAVDGIVQDLVRAGGRIAANTDAATGRTGRVVVAGNGGNVRIEGSVSAQGRAAGTTGGDIQILGDRTLVDATARVNASGRAGGGTIAIGVTPNGAATRRLSQRTGIVQGAVVRADATERGNGGTVLLNSTDYTVHAGTISVRGGPQGGNGGFVEVSGQQGLRIIGSVDVSAGPRGLLGTLLLDPTNLTVINGASGSGSDDANVVGGVLNAGASSGDQTVSNGFINTFVGNLVLEATNNLTVNAAINKTTGNLTLTAGNNLIINSDLVLLAGDLTLNASSGSGTPHLQVGALVQVSDANTITTSGNIGTINTQGRFVGGTLNVTNTATDVSLLNDNSVITLQNLPADGEASFRNIRSLRVSGTVGNTSNSYTSIDVVGGDLVIAGTVGGGGGFGSFGGITTRLRATGSITVASGGIVASSAIQMLAGYNFIAGSANPNSITSLLNNGRIAGYAGSVANSVELAAGLGGITSTAGVISTLGLNVNTGGSFVADTATGNDGLPFVSLDTLGNSTVGGDMLLVSQRAGSGPLKIGGAVQVGGTLSVRSFNDGINQLAGSVITAGTLNLQAAQAISLTGANQIQSLGSATGSSIDITNARSLNVIGAVSANNGAATLNVTGDLTVAGSITASATSAVDVNLRATGNINLLAGSLVASNSTPAGAVSILAGYDPLTGLNTSLPTTLTLAGTVGSGAGNVTLGAGTGGIIQTGGKIQASSLSLQSGGDALLSQPNAVSFLNNAQVAGDFVLDNGSSDLSIGSSGGTFTARTFSIRTAGEVDIFTSVTASERASFRVGALGIISSSFPTTITAPLVEIAPFAQVGMDVNPGDGAILPFQLSSSTYGNISTSTLRLGATTFDGVTTTSATEISFTNDFSFSGTVDVRATGNIYQGSGTTLDFAALTGAAGGSILLNEPTNILPVIGDLSAGTSLTLFTTGAQSLTGTLAAPSVSLSTGGALTQSGAGRISANALALKIAGSATLAGANAINFLTASTVGGDLQLNNTSSQLNIPVGNLLFASGGLLINQTGDLVVDGTVSGTATALNASGRIQVNGHSAIARTADLTIVGNSFGLNGLLQAAGAIRIIAPNSASLAGDAVGTLLNINSSNITFGGLNASTTPVRLFLGPSGTATGSLDASALSVFGGASANLFGTIAGISGGVAAATGRRGTSGGSLLVEPLPSPTLYLFNNCAIGATVCTPIVVSTGGSSGGSTVATVVPESVPFVLTPYLAPSANLASQAAELDPVAAMAQQLRPPVPALSFRLFRDQSEEGELAPPNVRGEDF